MRFILIVVACVGLQGISEAQQTGGTASSSSLATIMQSVQQVMLRQTINAVVKAQDGSFIKDSITHSNVIANSQDCTLTWTETEDFGGGAFRGVEVASVSLASISGITVASSTDLKLAFEPPLVMVRGFLEPGATIDHTRTGYRSDGSIQEPSKKRQSQVFSVYTTNSDEANELQKDMQAAQSACRATIPTAASGPTLGDSLSFIDKNLTEQGDFHFVTHRSGEQTGDINVSYEHQRLAPNGYCKAQLTYKMNSKETNQSISLGLLDPRGVRVQDIGWLIEYANSKTPNAPKVTYVAEPPVYVVEIKWGYNGETFDLQSGFFLDKSTAERVAKAYIHSIVLCGGGKDQPF